MARAIERDRRAALPAAPQRENERLTGALNERRDDVSRACSRISDLELALAETALAHDMQKKRAEHLEVAGMLDRQLLPNPPGPPDRDVETDFIDQDAVVVDVTPLTPDEIAASVRAHRLWALPGRDPLVALADLCREWVETVTEVDDGRRDSVASVQRQLKLLERQDALEIAIKKASAK